MEIKNKIKKVKIKCRINKNIISIFNNKVMMNKLTLNKYIDNQIIKTNMVIKIYKILNNNNKLILNNSKCKQKFNITKTINKIILILTIKIIININQKVILCKLK